MGSDTRADGILVGCLLAVAVHTGFRPRAAAWLPAAMLAPGVVALFVWRGDVTSALVVPTLVPWLAAACIWVACEDPPRWLAGVSLRHLGRISYGLYLWHLPLIVLGKLLTPGSLTGPVVAGILAVGIAELSWRFVEQPRPAVARATEGAAGDGGGSQLTRPQTPSAAGLAGGPSAICASIRAAESVDP